MMFSGVDSTGVVCNRPMRLIVVGALVIASIALISGCSPANGKAEQGSGAKAAIEAPLQTQQSALSADNLEKISTTLSKHGIDASAEQKADLYAFLTAGEQSSQSYLSGKKVFENLAQSDYADDATFDAIYTDIQPADTRWSVVNAMMAGLSADRPRDTKWMLGVDYVIKAPESDIFLETSDGSRVNQYEMLSYFMSLSYPDLQKERIEYNEFDTQKYNDGKDPFIVIYNKRTAAHADAISAGSVK